MVITHMYIFFFFPVFTSGFPSLWRLGWRLLTKDFGFGNWKSLSQVNVLPTIRLWPSFRLVCPRIPQPSKYTCSHRTTAAPHLCIVILIENWWYNNSYFNIKSFYINHILLRVEIKLVWWSTLYYCARIIITISYMCILCPRKHWSRNRVKSGKCYWPVGHSVTGSTGWTFTPKPSAVVTKVSICIKILGIKLHMKKAHMGCKKILKYITKNLVWENLITELLFSSVC